MRHAATLHVPPIGRPCARWALVAGLALAGAGAAQDSYPRFERLGIDDGLSQASVRAVVDDPQGFVWIGTQEGLNRFDGYQVVAFRHDPADPQSLSDNNIGALLADADGVVWVGTLNGGLNRRDPRSGRFQRFASDPDNPRALAHPWVRALARDREGRVWAGGPAGLHRLADGEFVRFRHHPQVPGSLSHDAVRAVLADRHGRLWVGTDGGGLNRLDPGSAVFTHYRKHPQGLSSDFIWSLAEGPDGRLWVGTQEGGIDVLDPTSGQILSLPLADAPAGNPAGAPVMGLVVDAGDRLWIATRGSGLGHYDPALRRLRWFRHEAGYLGSLSHNALFSLHLGAGGVLWAGSAEGLNRLPLLSLQFNHTRRVADMPGSLSHDWVRCFHEDPAGQLWVGTQEGLNRWDAATRRWQVIHRATGTPRARERDHVRALADAPGGRLWVGHDDGLDLYDPRDGSFTAVSLGPAVADAAVDRITNLLAEADGTLWIGTHETGLVRRDADGNPTRWRRQLGNPASLAHDQVRGIHRDRRGRLWIGTWGGGLCEVRGAGIFACHRHDPERPDSLPNDVVRAIHEDPAGQLWLATQGGGLVQFDPDRATARAFGRAAGLDDDSVYGVLGDAEGQIWVSTNSGLSRFDPTIGRFRNYAWRDGLQSREFNTGAFLRRRDGRLLFGGIGGFNQFDPATITEDAAPPRVAFTELRLLNRPVEVGQAIDGLRLPARIEWLDRIALDHRQRQLSIEFSALSYTDPRRNRYAYRLQGFDAGWIETDWRNRRATYTALPSGSYRLQVRASNAHGVWGTPATLAIAVSPAPWLSRPALLMYTLAALALAYAALRWRTARIRALARRLQAEVDARTAELRRSRDELERISRTDPLTGLGNRRSLSEALRQRPLLSDASQRCALLLLDIDHFKQVNDCHGHAVGDAVLVEVASRLCAACAAADAVARWGGEEFLLCLDGVDAAAALIRAEQLRDVILANPVVVDGVGALAVRVSIGFACLPFDPAQPQRLGWERVIALADAALYLAKQEGRNRVVGVAAAGPLPPHFEALLRGPATAWLGDPALRVLRAPAAAP